MNSTAEELRLAQNAFERANWSNWDAAYNRLITAERAFDRSRGIDPDAWADRAYERQQRAACLSDCDMSEVSHDPR